MTQINLPFEVGHTIEARSFELGFRGAWFRCKVHSSSSSFSSVTYTLSDVKNTRMFFFFNQITKIFNKGRALFYDLEYLDFTEEGLVPILFVFFSQVFVLRWLQHFFIIIIPQEYTQQKYSKNAKARTRLP